MTYTQNKSKKLWKNKNMCHLYIYIYIYIQIVLPLSSNFLFRQCHCQNQTIFFFFSSYFGNAIVTNQLQQFFFPPISTMPLPQIHSYNFSPSISAMPLPQTNCNNFFSLLFWQFQCHKSISHFFFFLRNDMCTQFLQQILSDKLLLVIIVGLKK